MGIHDLPGGFAPYVLAPVEAVLSLPEVIPATAGVLVEPLAAALNAVDMISPKVGERVAVLGLRRLGMLVVAALGAWRASHGMDFGILALSRHQHLLDLSRDFGATDTALVAGNGDSLPDGMADVVIDTTGNPQAFELAIRLARGEVHLKSTHGQVSAGLRHLTELVVDELRIGRLDSLPSAEAGNRIGWLSAVEPGPGDFEIVRGDPINISDAMADNLRPGQVPRIDVLVVDTAEQADLAIRPSIEHENSLLKPCGEILVQAQAGASSDSLLIRAVAERGLRLTSSRCGDFRRAIQLLEDNQELRSIGDKLITQRFDNCDMNAVFAAARSPDCIKAVVDF